MMMWLALVGVFYLIVMSLVLGVCWSAGHAGRRVDDAARRASSLQRTRSTTPARSSREAWSELGFPAAPAVHCEPLARAEALSDRGPSER